MATIDHLILGGALITLSIALTWLMLRSRILDVPNHRSSHDRPIPKCGGISIVLATYAGLLIVYLAGDYFRSIEWQLLGLGVAAIILAIAGFLDDMGSLPTFKSKLAVQFVACCLLLVFDIHFEELHIPFVGTLTLGGWGYPVTIVWVLALTNFYNFMDGLDGLAAGTAILVAACFGWVTLSHGTQFSHIFSYILFSASIGFFVFNFPKAKIFMGDVGSQFLGFFFAALAVLASQYDTGNISAYVMPLLFFHFIFDATFTFCRRLLAGENVTEAHKAHLYQLLNRLGYSHFQVSLGHFAMVLWQGAGAVVLMSYTVAAPALVLLPYLVFQSIYAGLVVRVARRRGLI